MADEYSDKEEQEAPEQMDMRDFDGGSDDRAGFDRGRGGRPGGRGGRLSFKKKVCKFCTQKLKADYKAVESLRRFTTDRGKLLPRRITGTCAKHQRALTLEVKRARNLALLPFVEK